VQLNFVISYNNKYKLMWDSLIILFAIWNCYYVPFEIAFEPDEIPGIIIFNSVIDLFFYIDIAICFRTSYINFQGIEITDTKQLAFDYILRGTFIFDILSVFPFEILPIPDSYIIFTALFAMLKVVRIRRLPRLLSRLNL
jgi:Ion transport protein